MPLALLVFPARMPHALAMRGKAADGLSLLLVELNIDSVANAQAV